MRLTLSVIRCPPSVPPETRSFNGGEVSVGRGSDNDWVMADPERHLSKRHFMLAFHGNNWQLADLSTNGTFLNAEIEPLGNGIPRRLRSSDRIRFGDYEIEARIEWAEPAPEPAWTSAFGGGDGFGRRQPQMPQPDEMPPLGGGVTLPPDFNPLASDDSGRDRHESWHYPTQADHTPSTSDVIRPPQVANVLPDDWADDLFPVAPRAPPAPPPPTPRAPMVAEAVAPPPEPVSRPSPPAAPPSASGDRLVAALLRGADLAEAKVDDAEALMEQVGEMMRAMVNGVRQALIARYAVKSEFRIERTMVSSRGNNPLKFSADDDDALAALIGGRRRSDMPPSQAVADALRDMRLHELATVTAMQAAVRALVAQFDPDALMREAGSAPFSMQRKARAWDLFEQLHATVAQNLSDDFDSVFGKSFARAYERAQNELAGNQGPLR